MLNAKYEKYKLINDGRELRPLINAGLINEAKYSNYPHIEEIDATFYYKGVKYVAKYYDGSFYPLLYKCTNKRFNNKGGAVYL